MGWVCKKSHPQLFGNTHSLSVSSGVGVACCGFLGKLRFWDKVWPRLFQHHPTPTLDTPSTNPTTIRPKKYFVNWGNQCVVNDYKQYMCIIFFLSSYQKLANFPTFLLFVFDLLAVGLPWRWAELDFLFNQWLSILQDITRSRSTEISFVEFRTEQRFIAPRIYPTFCNCVSVLIISKNKTSEDGDIAPWSIWNNFSIWLNGKIWTKRT